MIENDHASKIYKALAKGSQQNKQEKQNERTTTRINRRQDNVGDPSGINHNNRTKGVNMKKTLEQTVTLTVKTSTLKLVAYSMIIFSAGMIFGYFFKMTDVFSLISWIVILLLAISLVSNVGMKLIKD